MSEETKESWSGERTPSGLFLGALALAVLASIGGLVWSYILQGRVTKAEAALVAAGDSNEKLNRELSSTNARLKAATETLGASVGLSQKQMEARAQDILRKQQAESARLEQQQAEAQKQIGTVSGEVSSVKTDVGGVKTDVATTKADLAKTQAQLQSAVGDLGVQSGLIATNHEELEILKHKGDRNYFEFTLHKSGQTTPVSTVSLQLKKADSKHSRYTLVVTSDDKKIEKKDKGLNEPVQFYTGKDNYLYELVVNSISKDQIAGYISTPKNAPKPITP